MTFSGDLEKFASKVNSKIAELDASMKPARDAFLRETLGVEADTIISYEFDSDVNKFCKVEAPESVISKLREAGFLRD